MGAEDGTKDVAKAVEAWTNWDFNTFGVEIGKLLREFVMMAFPRKYMVDARGRLRRSLLGEFVQRDFSSQSHVLPYSLALCSGFAAMMALFLAVRVLHARSSARERGLV